MSIFNFVETPNTASKVIDTITLTASAYLSFPTFFVQKHGLKDRASDTALFARLYYDKQQNAIAIQFVTDNPEGLYKVNVSPQYGATCKIKAFLLNNEIDAKKFPDKYAYSKYAAGAVGLQGDSVYVIKLQSHGEELAKESEM